MFGLLSGFRMMALGGVVSVVVAGYWYYTSSQARIESLRNTVAASSAAIAVQENFIKKQSGVIQDITDNINMIQEIQSGLLDSQRANAAEVASLQTKFNKNSAGKERDIGELAAAKPALIEKIVNKATKQLGVDIEEITKLPVIDIEETTNE